MDSVLWIAALGVLAWRVAAWRFPHPADTDPEIVRLAMVPLGLWFLACGLWTWMKVRSYASLVFALYGIAGGIHWGGPVGLGPQPIQNVLLASYVLVGTALNQSLFLHLSLAFPLEPARARRIPTLIIVYLPAILGAGLLVALVFLPSSQSLLGAFIVLIPAGVLYSFAGGAVWFARLMRSSRDVRRKERTGLVVAGLVAGWVPHALVEGGLVTIPNYGGLANLAMAVVPLVLAAAFAGTSGTGPSEPNGTTDVSIDR